jgi:hypothetical protein
METNSMKRMFRICLMLAWLAVSVSACSQRQPDFSGFTTFKMYRESETDIVTLRVPNGYLDGFVMYGPPVQGAKEFVGEVRDALYLQADLPDLAPQSAQNQWKFQYPAELTQKVTFNFSAIYRRQGTEREEAIQGNIQYGLNNGGPFGCPYKPQPDRDGLESRFIDYVECSKARNTILYDYHYKRDGNGKFTTVLQCLSDHVPESGISPLSGFKFNPMCTHHFYDAKLNARFQMHYPRPMRSQWADIERRIQNLVHSFIVNE